MRDNLNLQNQTTKKSDQNKTITPLPGSADYEYQSKIKRLKKRIIFNISTSLFFIAFIFVTNFVAKNLINDSEGDISGLKTRINDLRKKSSNIESRINEVKKYRQIWIDANGKGKISSSIKISDINDNFNSVAQKYELASPKITISAPEILKDGVYNNQSFEVQLISCTLEFQSLTDRVAMKFTKEFISKIPGYVVISNLDIKKNKKESLTDEDLLNISTGKNVSLVSTKVVLSWYFLKNKPEVTK